jgi:adenosylcobyric acid synthase
MPTGLGYVAGPVLGIYLHGLFEQPQILDALFSETPERTLEHAFDELADAVETHLDLDGLLEAVAVG